MWPSFLNKGGSSCNVNTRIKFYRNKPKDASKSLLFILVQNGSCHCLTCLNFMMLAGCQLIDSAQIIFAHEGLFPALFYFPQDGVHVFQYVYWRRMLLPHLTLISLLSKYPKLADLTLMKKQYKVFKSFFFLFFCFLQINSCCV